MGETRVIKSGWLRLDIPIHGDPYVSRRHAEIVRVASGWGIRDLASTNGTRVNGVAVEGSEVRALTPEDVIEVVKLVIFVVFGSLLTLDGLFADGWAAVAIVIATLLLARPVTADAAALPASSLSIAGI